MKNKILFPIRLLFCSTESKFGLKSIREERMEYVNKFCFGKVLDIGCGPNNLFIKDYVGDKNGVGVDVFEYEGVKHIIKDTSKFPFKDNSFDTITLIAVGGHIPKEQRLAEFKEIARMLAPKGRLIMTEGEPISQWLYHKYLHFRYGDEDMDSQRGGQDEELCMPKKEIMQYFNTNGLGYEMKTRFMWGLIPVYFARKSWNETN